jgi:hypothetical protein
MSWASDICSSTGHDSIAFRIVSRFGADVATGSLDCYKFVTATTITNDGTRTYREALARPGFRQDHTSWDPVVPALAEYFRVLTYDRRGHSQSEPSTGEGTFDQDVADLKELMQQLDFAPALIVGCIEGFLEQGLCGTHILSFPPLGLSPNIQSHLLTRWQWAQCQPHQLRETFSRRSVLAAIASSDCRPTS